jgi:TonB family protein
MRTIDSEQASSRGGRTVLRSLSVAMALLCAAPSNATQPQPVQRVIRGVVESWVERLKAIDEELKASEWKRAKRSSDYLLAEMRERIEGGPASGGLLAMASLYRALAEAGLGDEREAAWDLRMAQALYPDYARVDLSPYGEAGSKLEALRVRPPGSSPPAGEAAADQPQAGWLNVRPPERLRAPAPVFPFAKFNACLTGRVIIMVVIDREGRVRDPSIVEAEDPVLAFSAMDAVREWRFRPARIGTKGEPTSVFYTLTVNYKLPVCKNPFARAHGRD